jgi:hypothetical protein
VEGRHVAAVAAAAVASVVIHQEMAASAAAEASFVQFAQPSASVFGAAVA